MLIGTYMYHGNCADGYRLYVASFSGLAHSREVSLGARLYRLYNIIIILMFCRLCVERCLLSCVIPVLMKEEEKVERLMHVYTSLDENATR